MYTLNSYNGLSTVSGAKYKNLESSREDTYYKEINSKQNRIVYWSLHLLISNYSFLHSNAAAYLSSWCARGRARTHTHTASVFPNSDSNLLVFWSTCSSTPAIAILQHHFGTAMHFLTSFLSLSPSLSLFLTTSLLYCLDPMFHLNNHFLTNPLNALAPLLVLLYSPDKPPCLDVLGTFLHHACPWVLETAYSTSGNTVQTHLLSGRKTTGFK